MNTKNTHILDQPTVLSLALYDSVPLFIFYLLSDAKPLLNKRIEFKLMTTWLFYRMAKISILKFFSNFGHSMNCPNGHHY